MSDYQEPDHATKLARRVYNLSLDAEARRVVRAGEFSPPPVELTSTLADDLNRPRESLRYRVESLIGRRHNVSLTGGYKTGKTMLLGNLTKSLADGTPFLGKYETEPTQVAFWNGEMDRDDFTDYLRNLGIENPERVAVFHLRGYRMPLTTDAGLDHAIAWLNDTGAEFWMQDSWARLCAWSGVNANDNAAVADLCAAVDEIKTRTSVDTFLPTVHTGRAAMAEGAEHGRGATFLDDWVDARWVFTRGEGVGAERFLYVEGRRVEMAESLVEYNRETGVMSLGEGNRRTALGRDALQAVIDLVTASPGINGGELHTALAGVEKNKTRQDALILRATDHHRIVKLSGKRAVEFGLPGEPKPQGVYYYPRGFPGLPMDWS